jgi:hypothetical protein
MFNSTGKPLELTNRERWSFASGALVLLSVLAIAACLRPDPRGQGTHEQLGLPPCSFQILFGKRCPSCGMTTAWAHFIQGHPLWALQTHVGGTLLAGLALVGSLAALGMAARGRRFAWQPSERQAVSLAIVVVALVLVEWGWRLSSGG